MWLTLAGSIVIPVGLVAPGVVMVQLPPAPAVVYLNTLSEVLSLTTHRLIPSVTMSLGLVLPLFKLKLLTAF